MKVVAKYANTNNGIQWRIVDYGVDGITVEFSENHEGKTFWNGRGEFTSVDGAMRWIDQCPNMLRLSELNAPKVEPEYLVLQYIKGGKV